MEEETIQPLITSARFDERLPSVDDVKTNRDENEHSFVTALSPLDLSKPIEEDTMEQYANLVRTIMMQLNKTGDNKSLDYTDFKSALNIAGVEVLESRAMALFEATALLKQGYLMNPTDLEIALMINDSYPVNSSYIPTFELFATFDIQKCGSLTYEQFKECVNALSYEERSNPQDSAYLTYLFRKNVQQNDKMDFGTFVEVWCSKVADIKQVLGRRGLLKRHKSRDTMMRISGFFSSVWRYFQLKDILQREMTKPGYNIITQFEEVRQLIVDMRMKLQRQKDKERRATKIAARKQQRKGAVSASKYKRQISLILHNEGRKTRAMVEENRKMREKVMKDCKDAKLKVDLEYYQRKQEKMEQEVLEIQRTSADKLILCDQKLPEIPSSLYLTRESQLRLTDIKIMDLSQNTIVRIPSKGFFFHFSSLRKLCLSRNNLESIPGEISCLTSLEILRIEENYLSEIPAQIKSVKSLQILDVSNNKLTALPEELCTLAQLKILKVHSNRITALPSLVGGLKALQSIDLSNNRLSRLPDSFCDLKCLIQVNLSNNGIIDLPFNVGHLNKLEDLDISFNSLKVRCTVFLNKLASSFSITLSDN